MNNFWKVSHAGVASEILDRAVEKFVFTVLDVLGGKGSNAEMLFRKGKQGAILEGYSVAYVEETGQAAKFGVQMGDQLFKLGSFQMPDAPGPNAPKEEHLKRRELVKGWLKRSLMMLLASVAARPGAPVLVGPRRDGLGGMIGQLRADDTRRREKEAKAAARQRLSTACRALPVPLLGPIGGSTLMVSRSTRASDEAKSMSLPE